MTYIVNLDEYESVEAHLIALYINGDKVTYFDSFGVGHNPKEIKKLIRNKNIKTNIYRMPEYKSIISGQFCIGFMDFMLKEKSLLDYTNCFFS